MPSGGFRALICLLCLLPTLLRAQGGECATQTWLAQTHHLAQVFAQTRHGPQAPVVARQLLAALAHYPMSELAPRLRAAGLGGHTTDITGFLRSQKSLAEAQILYGGTMRYPVQREQALAAFARRMQHIVPNIRCEENRTWRPSAALSGLGHSTPVARTTGTQASLFFPPDWPALSLIGCGLAAALAGASILLRRHAMRQRRREHRFPCALRGTLFVDGSLYDGRICDISQRGAKICLSAPAPLRHGPCTLNAHHWSGMGRIVWANAQCLGIAFHRPLAEKEVQHLIALDRKLHPKNA